MSLSSSSHILTVDPRLYCETINELHSYITSSKRGYLTQAELFRYYRQRHDNAEIPYRLLGYRSLLDLLSSDQRLFALDLRREPAYVYSAVKLRQERRERQQGPTMFSRQHHSTNTLGDRPSPTTNQFIFFEEHGYLSNDHNEHGQIDGQIDIADGSSSQIVHSIREDQSPTSDDEQSRKQGEPKSISFNDNQIDDEENFQETLEVFPDFSSTERFDVPRSTIQQRLATNNEQPSNRHSTKKIESHSALSRSQSTSTTSLYKSYPLRIVDLYLVLCTTAASIVFLGVILYKLC